MSTYDANNPTTKGRPCPHRLGEPCPGTQEGCAFWRVQEVRIELTPRLVQNCLFVLQFETDYQAVAEEQRTQNAIQHFNNQVHATVHALRRGLPPPALSGNFRKDAEVLRALENGGTEP